MAEAEIDITAAGNAPKTFLADGVSVTQHPIKDLIAADRYAKNQAAASKGRVGIQFRRTIPPGAGGV